MRLIVGKFFASLRLFKRSYLKFVSFYSYFIRFVTAFRYNIENSNVVLINCIYRVKEMYSTFHYCNWSSL